MAEALLDITQLGMAFPGPAGPVVVVEDFNLAVAPGEFVCLIGQSGCGKSTVLSIVMGLNEASTGGVVIGGREIDGPGTDRGVVFQSPSLFPWMTAADNVRLAVDQVHGGRPLAERRALARDHLARVGLGEAGDRMPDELSAGMKQRVGIARAFALEPRMLLLDEPFSLLDALTRMELQDELVRLWEASRRTVLMVTHDVDEALFLADRIVMMTRGPRATVGAILTTPFPRPRARLDVLNHPEYYVLRDRLTAFLEDNEAVALPAAVPGVHFPRPTQAVEQDDGRVQMVPMWEDPPP